MAEALERTWVDDLVEQAEQRGEQRSAVREQRTALRQVLRHRFGSLTPEIDARIESLRDVAHLRELIDRALEATSSDEVLTDL